MLSSKARTKLFKDLTPAERKVYRRLSTPGRVQDFLNDLPINFEKSGPTCYSPRQVLHRQEAQCLEGAIFAASALAFHGQQPEILDLMALEPDQSHTIAVFKQRGYWGAISKTNHAVLRYREPVYKTVRELVLSFFHEYFLDNGEKTLRYYTQPVNLSRFNSWRWVTSDKQLWYIDSYLNKVKHYSILQNFQEGQLRLAEPIEIAAGKITEWQWNKDKAKRLL